MTSIYRNHELLNAVPATYVVQIDDSLTACSPENLGKLKVYYLTPCKMLII